MNIFSRLAGVVVLLLLAGLLAACGGNDDPDPTPTSAPPTEPQSQAEANPESDAATAESPSPIAATPRATEGSLVAASSLLTPLTREEAQQQVRAAFPMDQAPGKGGTVIIGEAGDITTVNGLLTRDAPTVYITSAIFEPLLGASPIDGRPVPGLADSWDVADDGLTYTFHLNQDAKWHDGTDFSAEDVQFSFDSALDPNTGFAARTILNDTVESYRVVDPDTFEIVASDRLVTFLYEGPGSVVIMPKHIWESVGTESWSFDGGSTGQDPARVVGTGPFKFKEWVQGDHVTVTRNDDYYDVVPNLDAYTMQVLPNADAAVLALLQGQIDVMEIIPPEQTQQVQDTDGLSVEIYEFFQFTYWAFNLDTAITSLFQDERVRQAMFYAIDRQAITDEIFLGFGEVAEGTQPPPSPAYAPDQMEPPYEFDPAKAGALLADAGWTDTDNNGWVDKDGEDFSFTFTYSGGDATVEKIVAELQERWKQVGIKMELESVAGGELIESLESHDFDVAFLAVSLTSDGSQTALFSCPSISDGLNFMSYCSEEWDRLDQEQKRAFDPAERNNLLIQQSQVIWSDLPVGILRFGVARTGYSERLHNFYPNAYGFLWSMPYVWVEE